MGHSRIKCISNCKIDSDFKQVMLKAYEPVIHALRKRAGFNNVNSRPSGEVCSVPHKSLEDIICLCSSNLATSNSPVYSINGQASPPRLTRIVINTPKESNLPPSGVEVQRIGTIPMASEMARTRSSSKKDRVQPCPRSQKKKKDGKETTTNQYHP
jgi:hypothetical protein